MNYYNEYDHRAAEWLRELISRGLIPPGVVDERSICDVGADDLRGFTQCHFFAGIGGWSLALQLAGWPADRPVWTGSCPCQCFSTAGKQRGFADERDLWPVFARLICQCRPPVVFGEQVEAAIKFGWLDRVYADMEAEGYACGAAVLGAHSVGAPHRRYRLYWGAVPVDNADGKRQQRLQKLGCDSVFAAPHGAEESRLHTCPRSAGLCSMADRDSEQCDRLGIGGTGWRGESANGGSGRAVGNDESERPGEARECLGRSEERASGHGSSSSVGNSTRDDERRNPVPGSHGERITVGGSSGDCPVADDTMYGRDGSCPQSRAAGWGEGRMREPAGTGASSISPWHGSGIVYCRDEKIRRIPAESILFGVADGLPDGVDGSGDCVRISTEGGFPLCKKGEVVNRVTLLKGYGNAILPQVAAAWIEEFSEAMKGVGL